MFEKLIKWDIYEIKTETTPINGVMLRGRIRKLGLNKERNILVENTEDINESVRFAVPSGEDVAEILDYLHSIISDVTIDKVSNSIPNPVLSKLKVNLEDRYTL
jgi:hypothetical protein